MVSKHLWVGPLVLLWTFSTFWQWLVVQVGDTVVALRNQKLPTAELGSRGGKDYGKVMAISMGMEQRRWK